MRLFVFTVVTILILAFIAGTRPNHQSTLFIAAFYPEFSNEDIVRLSHQVDFSVAGFLPLPGLALVAPKRTIDSLYNSPEIYFLMDAKGLMGCGGTTSQEGLTLSRFDRPARLTGAHFSQGRP